MPLTSAQLATLKTDVAANTAAIPAGQPWSGAFAGQAINTLPNNGDANVAIAGWYNLAASPSWTIWRTGVGIAEVGKNINGAELAGLSTLNTTRLQTIVLLLAGGVDPSRSDHRAFFDDVFSGAGGVNTRALLLALWKKLATNAQKLFSTGTGSNAVPATLAAGLDESFVLSAAEVETARNLP